MYIFTLHKFTIQCRKHFANQLCCLQQVCLEDKYFSISFHRKQWKQSLLFGSLFFKNAFQTRINLSVCPVAQFSCRKHFCTSPVWSSVAVIADKSLNDWQLGLLEWEKRVYSSLHLIVTQFVDQLTIHTAGVTSTHFTWRDISVQRVIWSWRAA